MSRHLGDFDASTVLYGKFTTYKPSTGAPFTLGGTPALSVYKDNSTTQSTTGVTLTVDFDSVTGLHHFAIDTSADGTFYAAGSFFDIVITTGTVDSVSAVGTVVGSFTLRKTAALKPTTAGRTLDVSAGGEAGVDWANVGSPTTTVNLSGTTVKTATDVETDTQDIQSRLPAALVGGRIDANAGAISGDSVAADNLEAALDGTGGVAITAAITGSITGNLSGSVGSVTGAVGSVTGNVGGNVVGSVASVTASVTVGAIQAAAVADLFDTDSGTTYASAVAGSLVKEIADNAGGSALTAAGIADAVWDEALSGHLTSGSTGEALNAAGAAGDPWITALPGAYTSGQAGYIVGTNLDALISSRLASASYTAPLDAAGTRSAVGLASANLDTQLSTIDTVVDAILVDTAEIGVAGGGLTALAAAAALATVDSNVDAILVDTGTTLPATLAGLNDLDAAGVRSALGMASADLDTQLDAIKADTAVSREYGDNTVIVGTVGSGSTTTSITPSALSPAGSAADQFKGRIVVFDNDTATAALRGQATDITASSAASLAVLTVTALTTAPSSGDTFKIV